MRVLRSAVFVVLVFGGMFVIAVAFAPWALASPRGATRGAHFFCAYIRKIAPAVVGIRTEIRGTPPEGEVLVAAKHQSFLDIILIFSVLPRPKFIMKRELIYAPLLGQYALRMGCIPVDRGKRGQAIEKMLRDVRDGAEEPGQLIIYPQGTRVVPGLKLPYKVGTHALYKQMQQTCVPVATNAGLFWPRAGMMKHPGLAVVEFLDPIPPGLPRDAFLEKLEAVVEPASDRLMAEGGFVREVEEEAGRTA